MRAEDSPRFSGAISAASPFPRPWKTTPSVCENDHVHPSRLDRRRMPRFAWSSLAHSNGVHCAGHSPLYECSSCVTGGSIRAAVSDAFENRASELAVHRQRQRDGYSSDM
ncbi:hypothetical protein HN011_010465 [Eciton burchellii]|nr:hypothetical protein HN011_010465 [Eciton burchellii]